MTINFYFSFCDCKIKCFGACDIPLEKYFQDLSNGVLQDPKYLKCQLVSQEKQIYNYLTTAKHGGSFLQCFLLVGPCAPFWHMIFHPSIKLRERRHTVARIQTLIVPMMRGQGSPIHLGYYKVPFWNIVVPIMSFLSQIFHFPSWFVQTRIM